MKFMPSSVRFASLWALMMPLVSCAAGAKPAAVAHGANRSAAPASQLRFELTPPEVAASSELMWNFDLKLTNDSSVGFYPDSMHCMIEDTGAGETRGPRTTTLSLPAAAQGIGPISGGDSAAFSQTYPASVETGTLSFKIFGHRSNGAAVSVQSSMIQVRPGPVSDEHPSEILDAGGQRVEVVVFPPLREGPAPGLLLVHDHGANARRLLGSGLQYSMRGYAVVLVSLPGYGMSEGPVDPIGTHTMAALGTALDRLKRVPGVDTTRLGAWGSGQGAGAVMGLAARRADLSAIVAQSGRYELSAAGAIHAATLVLHGEADLEAPAAQARAFAAAIAAAGGKVESRFIAGGGHTLGRGDSQRAATVFFEARLKH